MQSVLKVIADKHFKKIRGMIVRDYKIIKLRPEDYSKCNNIWNMTKQTNTHKWYDELVAGNRVIFIYTVNDEFIGEGALVFEKGDPDYTIPKQRVYLSRLIVKREYRNQGIGSVIIDFLIEYAEQLGYEEISIGVDCDNLIARHLYEKKGFTSVIFEGEDRHGKYIKLLKKLYD